MFDFIPGRILGICRIKETYNEGIPWRDDSCMDNICRNFLDVMLKIDDLVEMNKRLYSKALKNI